MIILEAVESYWAQITRLIGGYPKKRLLIPLAVGILLIRIGRGYCARTYLLNKLRWKKQQLAAAIEAVRHDVQTSPINPSIVAELTKLTLADLRQRLEDGRLTSTQLLHAYQTKALQIFDRGNSGICEFVGGAQLWAIARDHSKPNSVHSPLYGIPVSVKESLCVAGYDSTFGLVKRSNRPVMRDCVMVRVLKDVGAIPFVLTSTTLTGRSMEGINSIFGDVTNPYNRSRMTGGSSCGECALLAQGGSPVGLASDTAGSIRIPAAFCGLTSLKPTLNRLSSKGMTNMGENSILGIATVPGPIGRRVSDVVDCMRSVLSSALFAADPCVPPLFFDEAAYSEKKSLCIGYYDTFADPGMVQAVPAVRDAVTQAVSLLERGGHRMVKFQPPNQLKAARLLVQILFGDGGHDLKSMLAHEPTRDSQTQLLMYALSLPQWLKVTGDMLLALIGARPAAVVHALGGARTAQGAIDMLRALENYRTEFTEAWNKLGPLDALICPVFPYPAPPSSTRPIFISCAMLYPGLYNLVNYPAGTVPMGTVSQEQVEQTIKNCKAGWFEEHWLDCQIAKFQADSEGLPLSIQVVGKPYCEETVLRIMRELESSQ
ncbi:unnamed protein product [Calicophoron daubneyi]|uniref:Amidase domain-containing protein n=1 Tax=Calicophoron daubneyi TaxID=300641 RepID=A0AAV2TNZ2_CALDB